jgi:hypothetical protein
LQFQEKRPHPELIHWWFNHIDGVNGLAVVTGSISAKVGNLACRDFDDYEGYEDFVRRFPDIARRCPTVKTSRGAHVWFYQTRGEAQIHFKWDEGIAKGELIASNKHYVCLPPSWHPKGYTYQWVGREPCSLADFPVISLKELGYDQLKKEKNKKSNPSRSTTLLPTSYSACVPRQPVTWVNTSAGKYLLREECEAINRCLPKGPGERNSRIFDLARSLKTLPHLHDADESHLRMLFDAWWEQAVCVVATKDHTISWNSFRHDWAAAKTPLGTGFREALEKALAGPYPSPAEQFADLATQKLIAVVRALARFHVAAPFHLSARTAADAIGVSRMTANRKLKLLVEKGVLEIAEKGRQGADSRVASTYRWVWPGPESGGHGGKS